jgi:NitT/TauT family transport system ATP-binding protein
MVFQRYTLFPWLKVRDNIEFGPKLKGVGKAERRRISDGLLAEMGLSEFARLYPKELSGGMQQRVAIARAVAYQPEVLIMDEPFAAVDAQTRADLEDLVRQLHRDRGMSLLFVTHDIDESVYLGERVIVLSKSPTWVQEDLPIDLAPERDQITTRALPRFTELRTHVYEQIQRAKRGEAVRPTA